MGDKKFTHLCRWLILLKFTRFLGGPNGPKICSGRTKTDFKDRVYRFYPQSAIFGNFWASQWWESTIYWHEANGIKASNKMQVGETVSRGSRHRSNHAQNRVPSVVAGHQFQEFGCIGPESRIFPTTVIVTHPGFCSETKHLSTYLPPPNPIFRICC